MKTIEFDQECNECSGTGLYVGIAEKNGAAIICHNCKGTGKYHFKKEYNEFTGRKSKQGIKRVYQTNPGIGIGENESLKLEDFGGMPYDEWNRGNKFPLKSEMRKYTCPAWWYQGVKYDLKPNWDECRCCGSFSSCNNFCTKELCWDKWDKDNNNTA